MFFKSTEKKLIRGSKDQHMNRSHGEMRENRFPSVTDRGSMESIGMLVLSLIVPSEHRNTPLEKIKIRWGAQTLWENSLTNIT